MSKGQRPTAAPCSLSPSGSLTSLRSPPVWGPDGRTDPAGFGVGAVGRVGAWGWAVIGGRAMGRPPEPALCCNYP